VRIDVTKCLPETLRPVSNRLLLIRSYSEAQVNATRELALSSALATQSVLSTRSIASVASVSASSALAALQRSKKSDVGAVAGGVVGGVIALAVIIASGVLFLFKWRKKRAANQEGAVRLDRHLNMPVSPFMSTHPASYVANTTGYATPNSSLYHVSLLQGSPGICFGFY
jgi:uncharacterized membrane protein YsdA (DUF1294 family)